MASEYRGHCKCFKPGIFLPALCAFMMQCVLMTLEKRVAKNQQITAWAFWCCYLLGFDRFQMVEHLAMEQSQYENMRVARAHFQAVFLGYPLQVVVFEKLKMQISNFEKKVKCKRNSFSLTVTSQASLRTVDWAALRPSSRYINICKLFIIVFCYRTLKLKLQNF